VLFRSEEDDTAELSLLKVNETKLN
jgi:hypothetical protein